MRSEIIQDLGKLTWVRIPSGNIHIFDGSKTRCGLVNSMFVTVIFYKFKETHICTKCVDLSKYGIKKVKQGKRSPSLESVISSKYGREILKKLEIHPLTYSELGVTEFGSLVAYYVKLLTITKCIRKTNNMLYELTSTGVLVLGMFKFIDEIREQPEELKGFDFSIKNIIFRYSKDHNEELKELIKQVVDETNASNNE